MTEIAGDRRRDASTTPAGGGGDGTRGQLESPDPRRWFALSVLLVAGFMDLVDVTIVNVALPTIQSDLAAAYVDVEWVVSSYVLGFAALLITGGRLGDLLGRRRMLLVGLAGFTVASLACGVAASAAVLITARLVAGAMAGLMIPQILAIVHVSFPPAERGKALGIWGAALGAASVAGLVLGGVLLQWNLLDWSWRSIFLVNVPVGLAAVVGVRTLVAESRSATARRLDSIGTVLAVTAVLLLVYPLTEGHALGWPAWSYSMMASSVLVWVAFVAFERRRARTVGAPLVALGPFRVRAFTVGLAVWALFWTALGGFFLIWTLYLQTGLGWTPLRAGSTAATFAIAGAAASGISVQLLVPRFGRAVLIVGASVNAAGFAGYRWAADEFGPSISSAQMIAPLAVAGCGFGLLVAPMVDLVLADVPAADAGSASGVLNTVQQVGVAVGVALAGVVFFAQLPRAADAAVDTASVVVDRELAARGLPGPARAATVTQFGRCVRERSAQSDPSAVPLSCRPSGELPPESAADVERILSAQGRRANALDFSAAFAFTLAYGVAALTVAAVAMLGLPAGGRRRKRSDGRSAGPMTMDKEMT